MHNEAALSQQSALKLNKLSLAHFWVRVERYQSHFIEMKELAQTAI